MDSYWKGGHTADMYGSLFWRSASDGEPLAKALDEFDPGRAWRDAEGDLKVPTIKNLRNGNFESVVACA